MPSRICAFTAALGYLGLEGEGGPSTSPQGSRESR